VTETRRFPAPWTVEKIPGGFKVVDAAGRSLVCVYANDDLAAKTGSDALTTDEARRIAANVAKLPDLLGKPKACAPINRRP